MNDNHQNTNTMSGKLSLNLAIVGGGKACRFFIELFRQGALPYADINIVGVCDINPEAVGFKLAKKLGIFTTQNFQELFEIKGLNGVIELTKDRDAYLELVRHSPENLWILDHNVGRVFYSLYVLNKELATKEREAALVKVVSEFLLQYANERIVVLNPDFTIMDANEAYIRAVNKAREEVIGRHCYEITHGFSSPCSEWEPEMGCPLVETLKTGQSAHVIHEHLVEGDRHTYCDLETYPVKIDDKGKIDRVIEIWRDITEVLSSRWEMRLSELKDDMEKLVQEDRLISLGKLSASCVHEINNPIQGLLTFCSLMQSILSESDPGPKDLQQFRDYLNLMSGELERCGNIVSGLLSFARESKMETRDVELNEILGAVISLTRHKIDLQDIRLTLNLSTKPLVVKGDVNQLQQCFLNLVFNAIEAMPQGGELLISSKPDGSGKRAQVVFQDSGTGISEKHLDRIFDPFFTTKKEGDGTGLGLSIVYGIVKSHKGHIRVKSRLGKGTIFTLHFPISKNSRSLTGETHG